MVLKTFFDCGNKADSTQYDFLSLATVSGSKHEWIPFEIEWKRNLRKYSAEYVHTTDLVTGNGIFRGWPQARRTALLEDCTQIARRHIALPSLNGQVGRYGLLPYVVTVNLKDFAQVDLLPNMSRNANELCLRQSLHSCLEWGRDHAACNEYFMFFDRGEPFYGYLQNMLESKKAKQEAFLLQRITQFRQVNMRHEPAMQLVDMYAWTVSHGADHHKEKWHEKFFNMPRSGEYHDKSSMTLDNAHDPEVWRSWGIPKRKPTQ